MLTARLLVQPNLTFRWYRVASGHVILPWTFNWRLLYSMLAAKRMGLRIEVWRSPCSVAQLCLDRAPDEAGGPSECLVSIDRRKLLDPQRVDVAAVHDRVVGESRWPEIVTETLRIHQRGEF